jgi:hypothetical protein
MFFNAISGSFNAVLNAWLTMFRWATEFHSANGCKGFTGVPGMAVSRLLTGGQ